MKYRCSKLERSFGVLQKLHSSCILCIAYVEGEKTKPSHLGREITSTVLATVSALERTSCEVAENWDFVGECFTGGNWSVFGG